MTTSCTTEPITNALPLDTGENEDRSLVSAAKAGDSQAFIEISKRYSRTLLQKTYRITNNWQDAEDIVQEAMLKAFVNINTFEYRSAFSTWLTRIAINSALMLLRKRRRSGTVIIDNVIIGDGLRDTLDPRDDRDNPEECYARSQTEDRINIAIQRMHPKYREVFELQHIRELTMNQIAESLRISVPAVKARLLRARRQLRRCVQGGGTYLQ